MRIGLDASPLVYEPRRGVARAVEGWIAGFARVLPAGDTLRVFPPLLARPGAPGSLPSPARHRRALSTRVGGDPVDVFLSPWSAFPRLPVPVVVTVHEVPFARHGPVEGRLTTWRHRRWLRRDVREAAAIVVPSKATREDLLVLHPEAADRVAVVPHGFDPAPWEAAGAAAPREGPSYGVIVGARGPRKGIATWVDAIGSLAGLDLAWTIVGRPEGALERRLSQVPGVRILPEPGDDEVRRVVAGARLLAYPSLSEGFGFPPLEAMAAGVPVVATAVGSIPEVSSGAAALVPPGDPLALGEAIRRVATDEALRADLVARGRMRCKAFSCEESARRLLVVLRRSAASGTVAGVVP